MTWHPTKTRLALLRAVRAGEVYRDIVGDSFHGVQKVTARLLELLRANWVDLDEETRTWRLTAEGERVLNEALRPIPYDGEPPLEGHEYVALSDGDWRVVQGKRTCRQRSCTEAGIVEMAIYPAWWAYCAEHAQGRWIEDGQVMSWHVVEVTS